MRLGDKDPLAVTAKVEQYVMERHRAKLSRLIPLNAIRFVVEPRRILEDEANGMLMNLEYMLVCREIPDSERVVSHVTVPVDIWGVLAMHLLSYRWLRRIARLYSFRDRHTKKEPVVRLVKYTACPHLTDDPRNWHIDHLVFSHAQMLQVGSVDEARRGSLQQELVATLAALCETAERAMQSELRGDGRFYSQVRRAYMLAMRLGREAL